MDKLIDYPNFKADIITAFNKLIKDFELILIETQEGRFLLKGNRCNLRITYDRGDIYCGFLPPNVYDPDRASYSIWVVYDFLYPADQQGEYVDRSYDPKIQLGEAAMLLDGKLRNVLRGDFSWLDQYLKEESAERKLSNFLLNQLNDEHSIVKKFWDGDPTWKSDIEKFIKQNNIDI